MRPLVNEEILGYAVTSETLRRCLAQIINWIESSAEPRYLVCANPHSIQQAELDSSFQEAIRAADIVTPDGIGTVIASRMLGGQIRHRITGSDVFFGLNELLNDRRGVRCFFLGSTEETLEVINARMQIDYPNIVIAGTYSPPFAAEFNESENLRIVRAINASEPDVLWVGMTAPKQEKWIWKNKKRLDVRFIGAIGAVFDFYSGNIQRSSPVFRKVGLEWLPRFIREPRRLWRRNLISNPQFALRVLGRCVSVHILRSR